MPLPEGVEGEDGLKVFMTGVLSTGRRWEIKESRKKSPGIVKGKHLVLSLVEKDSPPLNGLSQPEWIELAMTAHNYAMAVTGPTHAFRIAYNGPGVGTRSHVHIHIILPEKDEKLPPLVMRGDAVV